MGDIHKLYTKLFSGCLTGVRCLFTLSLCCCYLNKLHIQYFIPSHPENTHTFSTRTPFSIFLSLHFPMPGHISLCKADSSCWTFMLWSFFIFLMFLSFLLSFFLFEKKVPNSRVHQYCLHCVYGVWACGSLSTVFVSFYWCAVVRKQANCCMNFSNENFIFHE